MTLVVMMNLKKLCLIEGPIFGLIPVYWGLQRTCYGYSDWTSIRWNIAQISLEYAAQVLGYARGCWICSWYCSSNGVFTLPWDHSSRS